jgi:hypothetical protein
VLQAALRADGTFEQSIESLISALLQGPDFLYRLEFGRPDEACSDLRRPTDWEMATRQSYSYWGTQPDAELVAAASAGSLHGRDVVRAEAERLLADARARGVVRYFFERHLPLLGLSELVREPEDYPTFTPDIAALMREETLGFLEHEIFEQDESWQHILSAPSVFINDTLGAYYGIQGASDSNFVPVPTDFATSQRRGLLTQGGILTGTTYLNSTNPVARSMFVHTRLLCFDLPPDPGLFPNALPPEATRSLAARHSPRGTLPPPTRSWETRCQRRCSWHFRRSFEAIRAARRTRCVPAMSRAPPDLRTCLRRSSLPRGGAGYRWASRRWSTARNRWADRRGSSAATSSKASE